MKIWVDDIRPAPDGYLSVNSVERTKRTIMFFECMGNNIEIIDLDHDAGEYADDGGDYIEILNWLEDTGRNYPIRIHSQNPVGVENMRRIIERNGWEEVK